MNMESGNEIILPKEKIVGYLWSKKKIDNNKPFFTVYKVPCANALFIRMFVLRMLASVNQICCSK